MKEIVFSSDGDNATFDFYFSHNAQILLSSIGAIMIISFTILYLFKPLITMNDESFLFLAFFISAVISMHFYKKYCWLASRKRIEITADDILLYHAEHVVQKLSRDTKISVITGRERILLFPLKSISIVAGDEIIAVMGFKSGEDLDSTASRIEEIILQKNQV